MDITPKDRAETVALFRSEVIGALTRRDLARGELHQELVALSKQRFRPPGSKVARCFGLSTLERWYYDYKRGGLAALRPQPRSDRGRGRALSDEQRQLLCDIRREHPSASASLIVRTLVEDGRLAENVVSASTVRRLFVDEGLDKVALRDGHGRKTRLRWQAQSPGGLWQGDVCHGPSLEVGGVLKPLRVHALLDDASRYVVALEAHHTECEVDMLGLFCRALRRHGYPDVLYLDNGATYRGDALRLACERLGITLVHPKPGDAEARGKMERFWRTLREGCLDFLPRLGTLDDVNARLAAFLASYHRRPHASLMGRSPDVVFAEGDSARRADRITEEMLRDALTVREKRRVRRDTTVSVDGVDWELDQGFLAGRVVTVARSYAEPGAPPWVEHEGKRWTLHRVDPIANAKRLRAPRRPDAAEPRPGVDFAPAAAKKRDDDLWLPPSKESVVESLLEALDERASVLLCGDPGVGKTCVLRALRRRIPQAGYRLTYCHNATLGRRDFYRQLCLALGLSPSATAAALFYAVSTHVEELAKERIHPVFLLDEAHLLHQDTLNHLHILLNYQWDSRALLSLVLVGLPELKDRLQLRRNRSLYSRIHHRLAVGPLTSKDTAEYVRMRLRRAGCDREVFSSDALMLLHETTAGAMRDIDRIAALALREAARKKRPLVERDIVSRFAEADDSLAA